MKYWFYLTCFLSFLGMLGIVSIVGCVSQSGFSVIHLSARNGYSLHKTSYQNNEAISQPLAIPEELECFPFMSPGGDLVLCRQGEMRVEQVLFVIEIDTGITQTLSNGGYAIPGPWSPDGKMLAYMNEGLTGSFQLFLVETENWVQRLEPVPVDPQQDIVSADWSPDGKKLVLATSPNRYALEPTLPLISIYDIEKQDLKPLTMKTHGACQWPVWSPDGDWIAVMCQQSDDFGQIYIISPDGRQIKQITTTPETLRNIEPPYTNFTWIRQIQWLPNQTQIAYVAMVQPNNQWALYVTDLEEDNSRQLLLDDPGVWHGFLIQTP